METEATAPSTTAGPVLVEVPEPLVPAPPEFLCTWGGMRVELREGFTESSVKGIFRKFYVRHNLLQTETECHAIHCCSLDQWWKQKQTNPHLTLSKTFINK